MLRLLPVMLVWLVPGVTLAAEQTSGAGGSGLPRATVKSALEWVASGIEVGGVGIILVGAIFSTLVFLYGGLVTVGWPDAYHRYRANLGRGILLGLELLVAADIIGTVAVTPSVENLQVLALIVLIRTFLSFSLEVEIEGRWPWQRAAAEAGQAGHESSRRL